MGSPELQVFVSLFVILGAAFVALLCDFLKGNNERLRERNVELQTRHEERDKREVLLEQAQRQAWNVAVQAQDQVATQLAAQAEAEAVRLAEEEAKAAQRAADAQPPAEVAPEVAVPKEKRGLPGPMDDLGSYSEPERAAAGPIQPELPGRILPQTAARSKPVRGLGHEGPEYPSPVAPEPAAFPAIAVSLDANTISMPVFLRPECELPVPEPGPQPVAPGSGAGSEITIRDAGCTQPLPSYLPNWMPVPLRELLTRTLPLAGLAAIEVEPLTAQVAGRYWTMVARWPLGRRALPRIAWSFECVARWGELDSDSVCLPPARPVYAIRQWSPVPVALNAGDLALPSLNAAPSAEMSRGATRAIGVHSGILPASLHQFGLTAHPVVSPRPSLPKSGLIIDLTFAGRAPEQEPGVAGLQGIQLVASQPASRQDRALKVYFGTFAAMGPILPALETAISPVLPRGGLQALEGSIAGVARLTMPVAWLSPLPRAATNASVPTAVWATNSALPGAGKVDMPAVSPMSPSVANPGNASGGWAQFGTSAYPLVLDNPAPEGTLRSGDVLPVQVPAVQGHRLGRELRSGRERAAGDWLAASGAGPLLPKLSCPLDAPLRVDAGVGRPLSSPMPSRPERSSFRPFAPVLAGGDEAGTPMLPVVNQTLDWFGGMPDSTPAQTADGVVRIRVLREDDLRPIGGTLPVSSGSIFFDSQERRMQLADSVPSMDEPTLDLEEGCVMEGGFAYDPVSMQPPSKPPSRVIVMPAFDDLRTLFYPVAPSLERRLDPVPNVREMPGSARVEWLPAGLQTAEVYSRATRRAEPFTGAVMVIAINDYAKTVQQHGEATVQPILDDVLRFISEVAGAQAFLCRSSDDELVLLWPKERLPEPRQVFHAITEKLWDYQLRTLGGVTVIFGWGFHEAEAGSLLSAVGAAREQMTDNRRNRRTTMTGVGRFRRLMVS